MKLLLEHLKNNREALMKCSDSIGIAAHSVVLGTAREGLISNFIKQNLPEYISYHTGEVFDSNDQRSGQIDIVLHPITSPKINLHNAINIFPAETVLAAIEVKSNLTTGKKTGALSEALSSCARLKELSIIDRSIDRSSITDHQRIPFIIFAYKGPTLKTLKKHLENGIGNIRSLPDLIVVLDRGYYLAKTPRWMNSGLTIETAYVVKEDDEFVLLGIFEYLLKLIEYWFKNPLEHTMPIEKYTKDMPTLFDSFGSW